MRAWTKAEGGPIDNPLNIGPGRRYGSEAAAARATISLINGSSYYKGIRAAALTGNGDKQIAAIKASPWDASHYSNGVLDRTWAEEKDGGISIGLQWPPIQGIGGPGLPDIDNPFSTLTQFFGALLNPQTWVRVAQVLGGMTFLVIGFYILAKDQLPGSVKSAAVFAATKGRKK